VHGPMATRSPGTGSPDGSGWKHETWRQDAATIEEEPMGLAILLLILAIVFGVVGLVVEALQWIIVIALVLLVVSAVTGGRARRGPRP
jgi:Flp pilus assembly protein TadB